MLNFYRNQNLDNNNGKIQINSKIKSDKSIINMIDESASKNFFDLSYFDILFLKVFPCNNKYKILRNKFEIYKEHLYQSTDYSEVLKEVMSFKEFKMNLLKN